MHSSRPGKKTCKVLFSAPPPKPLPPRSTGALRTAMPPRRFSSFRQSPPRTTETATPHPQPAAKHSSGGAHTPARHTNPHPACVTATSTDASSPLNFPARMPILRSPPSVPAARGHSVSHNLDHPNSQIRFATPANKAPSSQRRAPAPTKLSFASRHFFPLSRRPYLFRLLNLLSAGEGFIAHSIIAANALRRKCSSGPCSFCGNAQSAPDGPLLNSPVLF